MRLVTINKLEPEMVLAKTIYMNGNVYLNVGTDHLEKYADRLERIGITCVYVNDEASEDIEVPDAISEQTRIKCKDALRDSFKSVRENMAIDLDRIQTPLNTLMYDVIRNKDVQINLTDINAADDYTFGHSVSTAVYAALIGIDIGYEEYKLRDLCLGAILHDVGKMLVDPMILRKEGKLTAEEFDEIKKHPQYSFDILSRHKGLPDEVRRIAVEHHERMNGSGYPHRLRGYQIGAFSRIVAIADVYDALSADRCYRPKWPNNKILDYLTKHSGTEFDNEMVASLLKRIAVYPIGTEVRMSDGSYGLIVKQNEQMPLRPVVKIFKDPEGNIIPFKQIDLMERLSITITASQLEIEREEYEKRKYYAIRTNGR